MIHHVHAGDFLCISRVNGDDDFVRDEYVHVKEAYVDDSSGEIVLKVEADNATPKTT